MRYAYNDLGRQEAGAQVTVKLTGSVANVMLLDAANFSRYRAGQPFLYEGGHYARSPVQLNVPETGHWYLVLDLGGYKGRVRARVGIHDAGGAEAPAPTSTMALG